ncbi:NAD(P)/FAD-dependent oxidoreductase [Ponticaulis profundi]|uniref:NAD(P)/FAD-dependent oxidoreductase n=1 Tax=Ponticaulis profundi TaxID=2665222 RepID=A0ABW1SBH8_9PROT
MPVALVIGAGIAGLATAWQFVEAGWQVRVFDRAIEANLAARPAFEHAHLIAADHIHALVGQFPCGGQTGVVCARAVYQRLLAQCRAASIAFHDSTRLQHIDWDARSICVQRDVSVQDYGFDLLIDASGSRRATLRHLPHSAEPDLESLESPAFYMSLNVRADDFTGQSVIADTPDARYFLYEQGGGIRLTIAQTCSGGDQADAAALVKRAASALGQPVACDLLAGPIARFAFRDVTRLSLGTQSELPWLSIGDAHMQTSPMNGDGVRQIFDQLGALASALEGGVIFGRFHDAIAQATQPLWEGNLLKAALQQFEIAS